jgi:hypothetical protein
MSALDSIAHFHGVHAEKRLFILASGPSLSEVDLAPLSRRLVMGLNRSFLVYPDTHYHCCMDQRLFDLFPELLQKARYLFTLEGRPWGIPMKLLGSEGFSEDLTRGVYSGYTISYLALQVAIYMGFKEVIYLGLDLDHKEGKTHFFGSDFHSRNHVDTEFPRMKRVLEFGAKEATKRGVSVFNCSPLSTLEGFTKLSFEEALAR